MRRYRENQRMRLTEHTVRHASHPRAERTRRMKTDHNQTCTAGDRQVDRRGVVAMQADRLGTDVDPAADDGGDAPVSSHLNGATDDDSLIFNNASGLAPRLKAPVRSVCAISERFSHSAHAQPFCNCQHD